MKPSEALEQAIYYGVLFLPDIKKLKAPGQIIKRCSEEILNALQELTSENIGTPTKDFLRYLVKDNNSWKSLLLEFDKKILKR